MEFIKAPDIKKNIRKILKVLPLSYIRVSKIHCMRSFGSKSRARARIWSFPRVWQMALKEKPNYIIEVLSEKFDHLSDDNKERVLIHELMHIPQSFGGGFKHHNVVTDRNVNKCYEVYLKCRRDGARINWFKEMKKK